jgi:hypothetical protein
VLAENYGPGELLSEWDDDSYSIFVLLSSNSSIEKKIIKNDKHTHLDAHSIEFIVEG